MLQNSYIGFLDFKKEAVKKLGMRANTCSFNPGVFVANLTEWKQQNITSQLEFWMERNAKLVCLLLYYVTGNYNSHYKKVKDGYCQIGCQF